MHSIIILLIRLCGGLHGSDPSVSQSQRTQGSQHNIDKISTSSSPLSHASCFDKLSMSFLSGVSLNDLILSPSKDESAIAPTRSRTAPLTPCGVL